MDLKRKKRSIFAFFLLTLILLFLFILNLISGSSSIGAGDILKLIFNTLKDQSDYNIIFMIRLPRILSGLLLGGALSVSGFLLQTYFSNPIAGPFVLGVSSGAKLAVAIALVFSLEAGIHISSLGVILAAFLGSSLTILVILAVARYTRQASLLIICGIMTGYLCNAVTELIINFADDSNIVNLHNWTMGSFSGINMSNVLIIFTGVTILFIMTMLLSKPIAALALSEEYALLLGVNIKALKLLIILIASMLSAIVTAFAGPIAFVGIASPWIMRYLFKTEKPLIMIPACFMGGSIFCLFSDLLARTLFAPNELSISTITSLFGAPVVIAILISRKSRRRL
ncbi:MAG: iron ABC transporter permease [Lachnospiraceae bacterium]|nr:iron ABC transporter permease [Lachnospiraceae bacterium]